jgi:glycosyltransferase involved in cell wall biosynthesis
VPARWNGNLLRRFAFPFLLYRKARKAFKEGRPYDIINVHEPASGLVAHLKHRVGSRIVVASHGLEHRAWKLARREAQLNRQPPAKHTRLLHPATVLSQCRTGIANADHVLCLSDDDRQYLKVHFAISNHAITRVFPGALPIYSETAAARDYAGWRKLLFAGTWRKNKGIEDLVPAVTELMQRNPEMEFRVLGGGIPKAELLSCFPAPLHARIHLLHTKTDAENAAIMADSDIFILPSLFEGTPLTLIEAMASGLPIVTTSTCGMRDVVEDGRNGLLAAIRSPKALIRAVERLIANRNLRRSLGENAQRDATTHYSWASSSKNLRQAYEQVLQLQPADAAGRSSPRMLFTIHVSRDGDTAVYKNTRDRAAYLEAQGCHCTILSPDDFPWLRRFGARFTPLLYPLAIAAWLFRRARSYDVATFHSYAGWVVLSLSRVLARFRKLRTVIQFHGLEPLYYARLSEESKREGRPLSWRYRLISGGLMLKLLRRACRRAHLVFCLNTQEQRFLVEREWAAPDRVYLLANPAPPSFFLAREYRQRPRRLLFVGQWLNMKGVRYLAQAFAQLRCKYPDLQLCCAGTLAKPRTVLSSFPEDVREHVIVRPRVSKSELLEIHRASDVFVFPTLSEGFSLALIEAMASGLPIVTTPVGASSDILQEGVSVVFCAPHDAESLANRIAELLDDPARREALGRNAQQAARKFRPELVWRDYAVCLNQLADRKIADCEIPDFDMADFDITDLDIEDGRRMPLAARAAERE